MNITPILVTTDAELEQCIAIRKAVFVEEQHVPADIEIDEYDASWDACQHVLLLDSDTPVATGRYRMYDEQTAKLQRIAVLRSYRGRGLGQQLIAVMERELRRVGVPYAILDGQVQAEPFYRKLGYVTISQEPFLDADIWHVRMKKQL